MLAREQTRGPEDAREGLVVEDPCQRLCEHGGEADLAVADGARQRLTRAGGAVLDIRDQLERAFRRPANSGCAGSRLSAASRLRCCTSRHGSRSSVSPTSVCSRRSSTASSAAAARAGPLAPDALFAHFDLDLELGPDRPRKRYPQLPCEARAGRQQPCGPDERTAAVRHAGARRRGVEARHADPHEVVAAIGLLVQRVGVAAMTIEVRKRGVPCRPTSGRLPSHATKLRRSVMSG